MTKILCNSNRRTPRQSENLGMGGGNWNKEYMCWVTPNGLVIREVECKPSISAYGNSGAHSGGEGKPSCTASTTAGQCSSVQKSVAMSTACANASVTAQEDKENAQCGNPGSGQSSSHNDNRTAMNGSRNERSVERGTVSTSLSSVSSNAVAMHNIYATNAGGRIVAMKRDRSVLYINLPMTSM